MGKTKDQHKAKRRLGSRGLGENVVDRKYPSAPQFKDENPLVFLL